MNLGISTISATICVGMLLVIVRIGPTDVLGEIGRADVNDRAAAEKVRR